MSKLIVTRAEDGSIVEIDKQFTAGDDVKIILIASVMIGAALFYLPSKLFTTLSQSMNTANASAYALLGVSLFLLLGALYRMVSGHNRSFRIADRSGMQFLFFQSMGTVPWAFIDDFDLESSPNWALGDTLLVAQFKNLEEFLSRVNNLAPLDPLHGRKLPFGTIDGSGSLDLDALMSALVELKARAG